MKCRHCANLLKHVFLNLGDMPLANAYLTEDDLHEPEPRFPLRLFVCDNCWLVQTEDHISPGEVFTDSYAYFSSISGSWLQHAATYCDRIRTRLRLNRDSLVVEIGSNDGYLLKNFVEAGIPCMGIEPTLSTAGAAEKLGITVIRKFFGLSLGRELVDDGRQADLIVGNNVYAHVPDINDFTAGLKALLTPRGTITLEFPHLLNLIRLNQFDTVYHEHYSYLSFYTVQHIFEQEGLRIYDVECLRTHGGSIRVYGCHANADIITSPAVDRLLAEESAAGLRTLATYSNFQARTERVKNELLEFLLTRKQQGRRIAAYGAAAKGNTLLNYAGIKTDLLPFVCDAAASKQGSYLPGSHLPILPPVAIREYRPDYMLILPWNIASEIMEQNAYIRDWHGKFVTAIPELTIYD